ncbi:MAG: hypothetical protein ROO70_14695 [Labrenzia sp.]
MARRHEVFRQQFCAWRWKFAEDETQLL